MLLLFNPGIISSYERPFRCPGHPGDGDLRADEEPQQLLRLPLRPPHPLHPVHHLDFPHAGHRPGQVRDHLLPGPALHLQVRVVSLIELIPGQCISPRNLILTRETLASL